MEWGTLLVTEYVVDGDRITSLETFYDEISRVLIPGCEWGRNFDAFNDILRGGFGTPDEGFVIIWSRSAASRAALRDARASVGSTVFDRLCEIIRDHGPGGTQAEDNVLLVLT